MKKSLPYIIAFLAGLFIRTAIAALNGWEGYHMNGIDLICAMTCIVMVWSFKGGVSPREKKKPPLNGNSASGKEKCLQGYYSLKKGICQVAKQEYKKKKDDRQEYLQEVLK